MKFRKSSDGSHGAYRVGSSLGKLVRLEYSPASWGWIDDSRLGPAESLGKLSEAKKVVKLHYERTDIYDEELYFLQEQINELKEEFEEEENLMYRKQKKEVESMESMDDREHEDLKAMHGIH